MSQSFESIPIDGAFIREFEFVPSEEVRIIFLKAPEGDEAEQVTIRSKLTFHHVRSCHASFRAEPWLEVQTHDTLGEHKDQFMLAPRSGVESANHQVSQNPQSFRIVCDEGEIRILADGFGFEVTEKLPYFKWSS